jgi:hypothetical protein
MGLLSHSLSGLSQLSLNVGPLLKSRDVAFITTELHYRGWTRPATNHRNTSGVNPHLAATLVTLEFFICHSVSILSFLGFGAA